MTEQEFKTQDLALATMLRYEGIEPLRMEVKGFTGVWIFPNGDPQLIGITREYRRGNARVEPLKFSRVLTSTRRQLFDFLKEHGVNRPRKRD